MNSLYTFVGGACVSGSTPEGNPTHNYSQQHNSMVSTSSTLTQQQQQQQQRRAALQHHIATPHERPAPCISSTRQEERQMSIDDHLSSLPSPNWLDNPVFGEQPPRTQEVSMLGGMVTTKDPYGKGVTPIHTAAAMHAVCQQQQHNTINSPFRCIDPTGSNDSSSSCSPSSSENNHLQQRQTIMNGGWSNESSIDVVNSLINNAAQLKTEPMDSGYGLTQMGVPMHLNPYQSARSSLDSTHTSSRGPSSVAHRRSRSCHDGMLKCQFCPKKWSDEAALHSHMSDCRLIRVHECPQCGKRFKARGGLQQHMRIHSNDRPYQCQFCAKRFTQKSHVDQHERIHTGLKPFVCQFCGRAFRQRSQQMGHESTHSHQNSTNGGGVVREGNEERQQNMLHSASSLINPSQSIVSSSSQSVSLHNQSQTGPSSIHSNILNEMQQQMHQQQQAQQQQQQQQQQLQQQNALNTQQHLQSLSSSTAQLNGLLGLNPNCANSAVSSLLALSQNMACPQPPHYNGNMSHALGIINSIQ